RMTLQRPGQLSLLTLQTYFLFFFFQAEDGIRDGHVTGVQTCALPISSAAGLDVANYVLRAGAFKMRVPLQRRQSSPAWNGKREALQVRPDNPSPMADRFDFLERVALLQSLDELNEERFVLPPDNRLRTMPQ